MIPLLDPSGLYTWGLIRASQINTCFAFWTGPSFYPAQYRLRLSRIQSGEGHRIKPGSVIISTTSVQATDPSAELFDYAQTKAANTSFVRSLAKQLEPKGICVNGVAPGPDLDSFAGERQGHNGKTKAIWRGNPTWQTWSTGRTGVDLCAVGCQ